MVRSISQQENMIPYDTYDIIRYPSEARNKKHRSRVQGVHTPVHPVYAVSEFGTKLLLVTGRWQNFWQKWFLQQQVCDMIQARRLKWIKVVQKEETACHAVSTVLYPAHVQLQ